MAAWGGVNWPKQVKRNRTRFQVLSAHKFNYTAAVKKNQKKTKKTGVWRSGSLHCLLCYIHPAQRSLLFFAFNTLTRGHLQPTASLTSDFKFKCARVSTSVFIWQEWTWVHYQRSWQRACTEGKFLKCSHHHCGALGVSPRRQRAAALLWLSSAIGFSVPLRYIKSQIEMTWPVYLVGGMQCVRRPAVAGR